MLFYHFQPISIRQRITTKTGLSVDSLNEIFQPISIRQRITTHGHCNGFSILPQSLPTHIHTAEDYDDYRTIASSNCFPRFQPISIRQRITTRSGYKSPTVVRYLPTHIHTAEDYDRTLEYIMLHNLHNFQPISIRQRITT